jgi:hypothetical protein
LPKKQKSLAAISLPTFARRTTPEAGMLRSQETSVHFLGITANFSGAYKDRVDSQRSRPGRYLLPACRWRSPSSMPCSAELRFLVSGTRILALRWSWVEVWTLASARGSGFALPKWIRSVRGLTVLRATVMAAPQPESF